jgi:hypothetical protein
MSPRSFIVETLARVGSSIFAGTLVSCLIVGRLEVLHFVLMGIGLALILSAWPRKGEAS